MMRSSRTSKFTSANFSCRSPGVSRRRTMIALASVMRFGRSSVIAISTTRIADSSTPVASSSAMKMSQVEITLE